MLKGIDVSHHNLDRILSIIDKPDFCIIKATEGKTYNDPKFKHNIQLCEERDIPLGFYHYARPENNIVAREECKHFLDRVAPYIGKAIFALDWEDKALKQPLNWAKDFLNYFYAQTGVRPLIYISAAYTQYLKPLADCNYGLWVAHYTRQKSPNIGAYPFWAFWQYASPEHNYTNEPCVCDYDYFNGSQAALKAYMKVQQPRF